MGKKKAHPSKAGSQRRKQRRESGHTKLIAPDGTVTWLRNPYSDRPFPPLDKDH